MIRMTPMLCGLLALTVPSAGLADTPTESSTHHHTPKVYDYSRFSNGPRRVPTPKGASKARAESLKIGTRDAASKLLHNRPDSALTRAAKKATRHSPDRLLWPVAQGRFGRGFGYVRKTRPDKRHNGVDIVADEGSVVRAAADGIVAYSDNGIRGYGNTILIAHSNGTVTLYAHLYRATVPAGWKVKRGERIGFVGNTGISRGPHLHFELRSNGHPVDPLRKFDGRPWIKAYRRWNSLKKAGRYIPPVAHLSKRLTPDSSAATPAPTPVAPAKDLGHMIDPHAEKVEQARHFRNLLWPLRHAAKLRKSGRAHQLRSKAEEPVRVAADGVVVFAGEGLPKFGRAIVVAHPNHRVTVYAVNGSLHVQVGQQVQRGEWIARVGDSKRLVFQLLEDGRSSNPAELFTGRPE